MSPANDTDMTDADIAAFLNYVANLYSSTPPKQESRWRRLLAAVNRPLGPTRSDSITPEPYQVELPWLRCYCRLTDKVLRRSVSILADPLSKQDPLAAFVAHSIQCSHKHEHHYCPGSLYKATCLLLLYADAADERGDLHTAVSLRAMGVAAGLAGLRLYAKQQLNPVQSIVSAMPQSNCDELKGQLTDLLTQINERDRSIKKLNRQVADMANEEYWSRKRQVDQVNQLEQENARLRQLVSAPPPSPLVEENQRLHSLIGDKDLRIMELEEHMHALALALPPLEALVAKHQKHVTYLKGELRQHGVPFDDHWGTPTTTTSA